MTGRSDTLRNQRLCQACSRPYIMRESPFWHNEMHCSPECASAWEAIKRFAECYPGGTMGTAKEQQALHDWIDEGLDLLQALDVHVEYGGLAVFDPPLDFDRRLTPQARIGWLCDKLGLPGVSVYVSPLTNMAGYFTGKRHAAPVDYGAFQIPDEPPPAPDGPLVGTIVISERYALGPAAGAIIAHELAHAYLYFVRLQGVYFWRGHEAFTDLASVALGLGKLYLNGLVEEEVGYLPRRSYAYAYRESCRRAKLAPRDAFSALSKTALELWTGPNGEPPAARTGRELDSQKQGPQSRLRAHAFSKVIRSYEVKALLPELKDGAQWLYRYGAPGPVSDKFRCLDSGSKRELILLALRQGESDAIAVLSWLVEQHSPELAVLLRPRD